MAERMQDKLHATMPTSTDRRSDENDTPGDRIRRLREAKGWSQEQLARKIHCSVNTVSNIERNRIDHVRERTANGIASSLRVDAADLGLVVGRPRKADSNDVTDEQRAVIDRILALPADEMKVITAALARVEERLRRSEGRRK
ncbi:MAG TPA: helix-turn-helix transcriptional regulator [Thermoanaerobaculia bacterium]|nr:helix-turn-helix transcriptional regulator [Thermoanaerobaculia bacterium]